MFADPMLKLFVIGALVVCARSAGDLPMDSLQREVAQLDDILHAADSQLQQLKTRVANLAARAQPVALRVRTASGDEKNHNRRLQFAYSVYEQACRADITGADDVGDGVVGVLDVLQILTLMDCSEAEQDICVQLGDIAGPAGSPDGAVGVSDLLFILQMYGEICPQRSELPQGWTNNVMGRTTLEVSAGPPSNCSMSDQGALYMDVADRQVYTCKPDFGPVTPLVTEIAVDGVSCFTTFELAIVLSTDVYNVHSLYGSEANALIVPAAYQSELGGADVGGVNPVLMNSIPQLAYDSWLTLGVTDASIELSTVGINFTAWTSTTELRVTDGAVIYLEETENDAAGTPATAPQSGQGPVVVAQLTIPTSSSTSTAYMNFQGHTQDRSSEGVHVQDLEEDWSATAVPFKMRSSAERGGSCPNLPEPVEVIETEEEEERWQPIYDFVGSNFACEPGYLDVGCVTDERPPAISCPAGVIEMPAVDYIVLTAEDIPLPHIQDNRLSALQPSLTVSLTSEQADATKRWISTSPSHVFHFDSADTSGEITVQAGLNSTTDFVYTVTDTVGRQSNCTVSIFVSDIDECADGSHSCAPEGSVCTNLQGSFLCECMGPVWIGDGYNCSHICPSDSWHGVNPSPADANELLVPTTLSGGGTWVMEWADMNGDGCIDLVRGAYGNDGNFPAEATAEWTSPDGDEHIQDTYNEGRWLSAKLGEVLLNDCNGNFGAEDSPLNNPMGLVFQYGHPNFMETKYITTGDVDSDGDVDVAVYWSCWDGIPYGNIPLCGHHIFLNDGTGNLTDAGDYTGGEGNMNAIMFDYDGDGDPDIVAAKSGYSKCYENNGAGVFADVSAECGEFATVEVNKYVGTVGDIDGDGDLDMVFGVHNQPGRIYKNNGTGTFDEYYAAGFSDVNPGEENNNGYNDMRFGDLDNDGDLDLAAMVYASETAVMLFQNSDGLGTYVRGPLAEDWGTISADW
eukprot:SAG31_NODE_340_length_17466_cov_5.689987_13_plen_968_part_00